MNRLHVVVPEGIDDPSRPSGGNIYDRHICDGLARLGWQVHEHVVPGTWPTPDAPARRQLVATLRAMPDDGLVVIDGLIASSAAEQLLPDSRRLRQIVLMHMPQGDERDVVRNASAVVATSQWTRRWLLETYALPSHRVHVVEPGAARAAVAAPSSHGSRLVCVGALAPHKGQDILIEALATLADEAWSCRLIGSREVDPPFARELATLIDEHGLRDRVTFCGPLEQADVDVAYATADLLVHPARHETYGMVITEALAHAVPVLATDVGGVATAVGAVQGRIPGLLVAPEDPEALATALRRWLADELLRRRLRKAALDRRDTLAGWDIAAKRMSAVLRRLAS